MPAIDRIDVWLGVAGIVKREDTYLVVKKRYGGLKNKWSFPGGFVEMGETIDQAVLREIREETGIDCRIKDIIGIRSGVIKERVSDNLILFELEYEKGTISVDTSELLEAKWLTKQELLEDPFTAKMIHFFLSEEGHHKVQSRFQQFTGDPGKEFGYTEYKIFKKG